MSQKTWFKMPAYSWKFNPTEKNIEHGDKIIVHTGILHALMQRYGERPMPHPLIFEIMNLKDRRISHCGVLEFSAEQSVAFLPEWMMINLGLTERQEIQLKLKELPLGTGITFQPLKWDFGMIPTPKLALEHALRTFTALTVGDTIQITVGTKAHSLIVKEIKPDAKRPAGQPNACCVIDASLTVEFLPPLEVEPEDAKPVEIALGASVQSQATADTYKYFRVKTLDAGQAVQIEVTPIEGDPEIFVSTSTNKPELTHCTWKSVGANHSASSAASSTSSSSANSAASTSNGVKRIVINPNSLGFITGWYYIGVFAYKVDTVFELVVREIPPNQNESKAPTGPSVGSLSSSDPNAIKCPTCGNFVSQKAFTLHSVQCARMNVYCEKCAKPIRKSEQATHAHCDICNGVMHPDELPKHIDLIHKSVACPDCGDSVDPAKMVQHKSVDCSHRPVQCKYCSMELAFRFKADHESYCGATSDLCDHCGKPVARRRMDTHLAVEHRINVSLKSGDRNSMGSSTASMTAQQYADQQRAAAGFRTVTKDDDKKTVQPPPLTDDEALARAIAASMDGPNDSGDLAMHDPALQQVLAESRSLANPGASSSSSFSSSAAAGASSISTSQPLPPVASSHDDDFGMDEEDAMEEDEVVQTWDEEEEQPTTAASGGDELCPYCNRGFLNFTTLERHMESCTEVDA